MCGGCLSVAYTLTGVRGNDDDDSFGLEKKIEYIGGVSFQQGTNNKQPFLYIRACPKVRHCR